MASPILYARFEPQLYERVLQAAESEGSSLSVFLRMAVEEKLGTVEREAAERAVLLAEARKFLANPGTDSTDREATGLVERYVAAIEAHAGRISVAEAHGRALEPLDGQELTFPEFPAGRSPGGAGAGRHAAAPRLPEGGPGCRAGPRAPCGPPRALRGTHGRRAAR